MFHVQLTFYITHRRKLLGTTHIRYCHCISARLGMSGFRIARQCQLNPSTMAPNEDDWQGVTNPAERKKRQSRLRQRAWRKLCEDTCLNLNSETLGGHLSIGFPSRSSTYKHQVPGNKCQRSWAQWKVGYTRKAMACLCLIVFTVTRIP